MALTKVGKLLVLAAVAGVGVGGYIVWRDSSFNPAHQTHVTDTVQTPPPQYAAPPPAGPAPTTPTPRLPPNTVDAPATDTLKAILASGVVRISVENPSEPFYGVSSGVAHGFNVDFAKLLFAQP